MASLSTDAAGMPATKQVTGGRDIALLWTGCEAICNLQFCSTSAQGFQNWQNLHFSQYLSLWRVTQSNTGHQELSQVVQKCTLTSSKLVYQCERETFRGRQAPTTPIFTSTLFGAMKANVTNLKRTGCRCDGCAVGLDGVGLVKHQALPLDTAE